MQVQTGFKSCWHRHPHVSPVDLTAHSQRWSEMFATLQLHLVCQLLPDGQQGTGSVGWAGQQLLKAGPFFLTERKEGRGQHGENKNPQDPHSSPRRLKLEQTAEAQSEHEVQYQGTQVPVRSPYQ